MLQILPVLCSSSKTLFCNATFQIVSIQEVGMVDMAVGTAAVVAMVMIWEVTVVVAMVRMVDGVAE